MPPQKIWRWRLVMFLALFAAFGLVACAEEEQEDTHSDEECLDNTAFFAQKVWPSALSKCVACHNPQGDAKSTNFILQDAFQTGFLDSNMRALASMAEYQKDGKPLILIKPVGDDTHTGGVVLQKGSEEFEILSEMIDRFNKPVKCEVKVEESFYDFLEMMTPKETLRKATLSLAGRLPSASEIDLVERGGLEGLDAALDQIMQEDGFKLRIKEIFNDLFLTNRYLGGSEASDLLSDEDFPNRYWYDDDSLREQGLAEGYINLANRYSNNSLAQEVLELVSYVIDNDLPFSEILTADYTMVNPFSAEIYGLDIQFEDPTDPNDWQPGRVKDIPHAGLLTSPMFLNRFPTTDTNVNRHRSRMVWSFFLATDILKLASRPIDPTAITGHNPTMNDANCVVCHSNMDPIAGAFQNWSATGRYMPPEEGWHADMLPPGFGSETIPWENRFESLQWLGARISEDPRFVTSTIHNLFFALTGQRPLSAPTESNDPDYDLKLQVFLDQDLIFREIGDRFIADNYNFKTIVKGIINTRYYRARNIEFAPDETNQKALDEVGSARFLTPEMLNRKIKAVLGYPWKSDRRTYLTSDSEYLIFYGGIDSDSVTQRISDPNGLMANITNRMGNEMACLTTARDFVLSSENRTLFPHVEIGFVPEDQNGFPVDSGIEAIKKNIQHLHAHILGEEIELGSDELEATYALFYETWKEGIAGLAIEEGGLPERLISQCRATNDYWNGESFPEDQRIENDPDYTIRAWMAVVSYLLSDYRFIHE